MECNDLICNIVVGLVTGFISGLVVYVLTTKRERRNRAHNFIKYFLFNSLDKIGMVFPAELMDKLHLISKGNAELNRAILDVISVLYIQKIEDVEMTDEENEIFQKISKALDELSKVE